MSAPNGGPAFPLPEGSTMRGAGMTLRDYFAAKAMQGVLSDAMCFKGICEEARARGIDDGLAVAKFAYELADAMLQARGWQA